MVGETTRKTNQIIIQARKRNSRKDSNRFVPFPVAQAARGVKFDSSHAHKGHDEWGRSCTQSCHAGIMPPLYERKTHANNTKRSARS